jgi:hypothetical protein
MSRFIQISTLNDAEYFLNNARGLPLTTTGRRRSDIYRKSVVVFSWMALEEIVRLELASSHLKAKSYRLWDQIELLVSNKSSHDLAGFDASKNAFLKQRKVRNGVAHALEIGAEVTLEEASSCFSYCKAAIAAIVGFR